MIEAQPVLAYHNIMDLSKQVASPENANVGNHLPRLEKLVGDGLVLGASNQVFQVPSM